MDAIQPGAPGAPMQTVERALRVLERVQSARLIRSVTPVGSGGPLHCTAAGKVLLAWLRTAEIQALMIEAPPVRYTARTITEIDALMSELEKVRAQGVAFSRGEHSY